MFINSKDLKEGDIFILAKFSYTIPVMYIRKAKFTHRIKEYLGSYRTNNEKEFNKAIQEKDFKTVKYVYLPNTVYLIQRANEDK